MEFEYTACIDGIDYGFFIWKMRPAAMKDFRRSISATPTEFLDIVAQVESGKETY